MILVICLKSFNLWAQNTENNSLKQRIELLQANEDYQKDTLYIDLLYQLGLESAIYNLDSLKLLANETILLSQSINYKKGEAQGFMNIGSYFSETGDHNKAIENFKLALRKAKEIGHIEYWFRSKNLLAKEYEYNDDLAKALREYLEGIEMAKERKSGGYLSTFYVNASNLYGDQMEFDQSIHFLNLAKENNKNINDNRIKGVTLANLAASYIEINDLKTADNYTNECIVIFEDLGLEYWQMYAYELKATIFLKQGQPSRALKWFQKSEKIHESIDQIRYKIPLYNGIAKAYFDLKDYTKSEVYAENALDISKKISLLDEREISLNLLYQIKKNKNLPVEALSYLEELKTLSDTLNKYKNEKELRILKSNLEFGQEKERYVLENEKRLSKQQSYLYGAILIILMFSIIIFILKKNNKVQNKLNEELTKKEAYLNNANNTKSRLFSIIAHDLRGPINSVNSIFDLLASKKIEVQELYELAPQLKKNMNGVSSILNNLLAWGQTQMNNMITKPEVNNIYTLVKQNIALLSETADQKSITLTNEVEEEVLTWSDINQIDIVIRNLLSNAIKFTPNDGNIRVGAREKANHWEIFVKDTGVGISQEMLPKIFNTQETFTTYGTDNEKGTGLGLVLCQEMVENNNGTIWVESTKGKGTSFYFTIPKLPQLNS